MGINGNNAERAGHYLQRQILIQRHVEVDVMSMT